MRITRSIDTPIRSPFTGKNGWEETWQAEDRGLIICWERGREQSVEFPELAAKARAGELPVTTWKGGIARTIKKKEKYGCLEYLAHWQGLCGKDLVIVLDTEVTMTCTATGMRVVFTGDWQKYATA